MFQKILLASDGSKHALRAAEKAAHLAHLDQDATVTIAFVVDGSKSKSDVLSQESRELIEYKRKESLHETERYFEEQNVPFEVKILKGEPGPTLIKVANEQEYDLVILGSRGLNTLQEMVLGSVSHKVAKRANCPVMIIK
ncbi:universal stress protein [Bacillus sp. 2205SS5-2]|uniref:universal stress protein n=1 Tax=Bacillus sp. 2205SS5-2 TaxID=3109031 RepID=UPI003004067E